MVKPRFPGHVEAPSATRRATDKWAHDTMRSEQLDSGSTHTSQPQEGCALLHPLQGVSLLSTPLQGGILKAPALRVVVDLVTRMPPQSSRYPQVAGLPKSSASERPAKRIGRFPSRGSVYSWHCDRFGRLRS